MTSEPNVKQTVPLLNVSNIEQSVRYYIDGLGFEITQWWTPEGKLRWCWLQLGRAALMLQEREIDGHDAWVPDGKVGEGVSFNFICQDALSIYRAVSSRGIEAQRPFVGNGMWVVSLTDPDGYSLNFESLTDVAEETLFDGH